MVHTNKKMFQNSLIFFELDITDFFLDYSKLLTSVIVNSKSQTLSISLSYIYRVDVLYYFSHLYLVNIYFIFSFNLFLKMVSKENLLMFGICVMVVLTPFEVMARDLPKASSISTMG